VIPGGYTPTDRPKTAEEFQTGSPQGLYGERRRTSGKGAWITLAVVVLLILGVIMLLSFVPDTAGTVTSSIPVPADAPAG